MATRCQRRRKEGAGEFFGRRQEPLWTEWSKAGGGGANTPPPGFLWLFFMAFLFYFWQHLFSFLMRFFLLFLHGDFGFFAFSFFTLKNSSFCVTGGGGCAPAFPHPAASLDGGGGLTGGRPCRRGGARPGHPGAHPPRPHGEGHPRAGAVGGPCVGRDGFGIHSCFGKVGMASSTTPLAVFFPDFFFSVYCEHIKAL